MNNDRIEELTVEVLTHSDGEFEAYVLGPPVLQHAQNLAPAHYTPCMF